MNDASPTTNNAGEPAGSWVSRFNLSQWALDHQAFTRYLMIVLMVLGVAAYFQLGQDEDPPFTFRAMVVRAYCLAPPPSRSPSRWPTTCASACCA